MRGRGNGNLFLSIAIIILMVVAVLSLSHSKALASDSFQWSWQNPLPQGNGLLSVTALDSSHVWAVGMGGAIVFYDGSSWMSQAFTGHDLNGVSALDSSHVWAVGDGGNILFFNGTSWSTQNSGTVYELDGVYALDATHVWAVGYRDILFFNGTSWSTQTSSSGHTFYGVSAFDSSHVWAVGGSYAGGLVLFYDGASWVTQSTAAPDTLFGISAYDQSHVWATGYNGEIFFYDGVSWASQTSGTTVTLNGVSAKDPNHVWAVGEISGTPMRGTILFYNGTSWVPQTSGTFYPLYGVCALDALHVWAVGEGGRLLFFNGLSWSIQNLGTSKIFKAIDALDISHVWVVGESGAILFYDGTSWSDQSYSTTKSLNGVCAVDASHVWAVGNSGIILFYNGTSWSDQSYATAQNFTSVSAVDSSHVWALGPNIAVFCDGISWSTQSLPAGKYPTSVSACDANHAWAVGNMGASILFFDGSTWSTQSLPGSYLMRGVFAVDPNNVWAVGLDNILFYNGTSWSIQASYSWDLYGISVLDASHIWAVGTNGVIAFYNGTSWSTQNSHICNFTAGIYTYRLYGVAPCDANNVWAVGTHSALLFGGQSPTYTVDATMIGQGIVSPTTQTVDCWSSASVGFAAASGWHLASVIDNGTPASLSSPYTIASVNSHHDVVVTFESDTNTVDASVVGQGTVDPPTQTVDCGAPATITFAAASGWHLASVIDNGTPASLSSPYTIASVNSHHDVVVMFAINTYTVNASVSGGSGTVDPPTQTIDHGSPATITFAAAPGWHVGSVTDNGVQESLTSPYTIASVTSHHDIVVMFAINTYTVNASVSGGSGTVDPPTQIVDYGSNASINIAPDRWYNVQSITDNGTEVPIANPYVIANVQANHDIFVTFTVNISTFYFAEGYTGDGFEEWLCLLNPGDLATTAHITYMFSDGTTQDQDVSIGATSRSTVDVNGVVGLNKNVSVAITADDPIVAERPMYFNYKGKWSGGHDVMGATSPQKSLYFAEGYTGANAFDEWLCIANPNSNATTAHITYMFTDGTTQDQDVSIGATSRSTVDVNGVVGLNKNVSVAITADDPIVAERPMYFNYKGKWSGGHDVMGATSPQKSLYFAEGYTGANAFDEWLCIANPNSNATTAHITYMFTDGTTQDQDVSIGATSRSTVDVNGVVGLNKNVSVAITADDPIVAERPMYFNYKGKWSGGHDVMGATSPQKSLYFAEGYTGANAFDEWLCIANPNSNATTAHITYMFTDGTTQDQDVSIGATSRSTVDVNGVVGLNKNVSVAITADDPIVAERPMYFNYKGKWSGGHDVMGLSP